MTDLDYESFFNRKADWAEELDEITESTRVKLKTVLFRMMREAGITSDDNLLVQALLSQRLIDVLNGDSAEVFRIYPLLEADIGVQTHD